MTIPWNKGKIGIYSLESRKKMSESAKGNTSHLGKPHSEETKRKLSEMFKGIPRNVGENNPSWKGDNVGYRSLHEWVRNHLPEPELCQTCNIMPPFDLANITGTYTREFTNWKYLCRKCHRKIDLKSYLGRKRK